MAIHVQVAVQAAYGNQRPLMAKGIITAATEQVR